MVEQKTTQYIKVDIVIHKLLTMIFLTNFSLKLDNEPITVINGYILVYEGGRTKNYLACKSRHQNTKKKLLFLHFTNFRW